MNRPRMSTAASALLRTLLNRATNHGDRILLTHWVSTDWRSVTFSGERHQAGFRLTGPDALALARQWTGGIEEADLPLGRHFVAEIALSQPLALQDDGSVLVELEALTLED
jgi:hypothetical protein